MTKDEQDRKEFADVLAEFDKKLCAQVPGISQIEVAMAFGFAMWTLVKDVQQ